MTVAADTTLDENGFPQGTGGIDSGAPDADSLILVLGQDTDTAFTATIPGIDFKRTGPSWSGRGNADRLPGRVRGRRHGAVLVGMM